jgi:DNA-binding CsgD family transcriptional regulator
VEGVLAAVRGGLSGVLVLRGEAGIGKTALLEWAAGRAEEMQLARVAGVQAEMGMGFAGLHQVLVPFLDGLDGLPGPQRQALESAFGLVAGPAPDRFLVGLAALTLLTDAAAAHPVLCLVDDAQWLDQVSVEVLGFIARRLYADRVGMVLTVREGEDRAAALAGLPELRLAGLPEQAAAELLAASAHAPVDGRVSTQVVAGVAGNPLALVELAGELTPAELSGMVPLGWPLRFGGQLEELYLARVRALRGNTQKLLLVAAADPSGDLALVAKAASQLGTSLEAGETAETRRLVSWQPRVRFRHPLIRSAAYYAAPAQARRDAHAALAAVTDPGADPDRRAWHRAEAALGPDEQIAAELEHSAGRAQARGGLAAAATFLERAAALTPEPACRAQRLLAAAQAKRDAGALDAALGLLMAVEAGPDDALRTAEVEHLRGQIALDQRRGSDAARLLLSAARRFEPLRPGRARETHLEALWEAAMLAGNLDNADGMREAAEAAAAAPPGPDPPRVVDVLLDALALRFTQGHAAAGPALARALELVLALDAGTSEADRWLLPSGGRISQIIAIELWDFESWHALATRQAQLARGVGALVHLQFALNYLARAHLLAGELATAALMIEEDHLIAEATGNPPVAVTEVMLAAWRGRESQAWELIEATVQEATARSSSRLAGFAAYASSVLYNSLGRHDAARDAAWQAFQSCQLGHGPLVVSELAEGAAKAGDLAAAGAARDWVAERARVRPTEWALGIEARIRALISDGDAADNSYRESIERLGRTRLRPELARAHLLYGEWLRRQRRRRDARDQLRTAFTMFDAMGMAAFAARARAELRATGERARPRSPQAAEVLTPQEEQIARLVAEYLTNREIVARLFVSASTVEYHLHKIFRKLGVSSRTQLARTIHAGEGTPVPRPDETLRAALYPDPVIHLGDARRRPGGGHRVIVRSPGAHCAGQAHQATGGRLDR